MVTKTEQIIAQMQSSPTIQALAEEFARCADVQQQVDLIAGFLGVDNRVRIVDREKYTACEKEHDRLLRNWARRERHRTAKIRLETGRDVPYGPRPTLPCTCGYHHAKSLEEGK